MLCRATPLRGDNRPAGAATIVERGKKRENRSFAPLSPTAVASSTATTVKAERDEREGRKLGICLGFLIGDRLII